MGKFETSHHDSMGDWRWGAAGLLIPIVIAVSFLCLCVFVSGQISKQRPQSLPAESINILQLESNERLRRRKVSDQNLTLDDQFTLPQASIRQYSHLFILSSDDVPPQRTIVPQVGGSVVAYVNGVRIGQERARPYVSSGQKPFYIDLSIPNSHFQTGNNRLEFIITPNEWGAEISEIYLGSKTELEPVSKEIVAMDFTRKLWAVSASLGLLAVIIGLALSWAWQRYFVYGIASGALMLKAMLSNAIALSAGISLFPASLVIECILGLCVCALFIRFRSRWTVVLRGLALAAVLALLLTAFAFMPLSNTIRFEPVIPFMAVGVLPFLGFALWTQLWADYRQSKTSKKDLINKLTTAEHIIIDQRAALDLEIKKSAQMEERQRLTRDIHDGIGGHLLSLLVRVQSGDASQSDIEAELQSGLNDLRLIVDSMDHSADDIESALKTFHARAKPQLMASGIALDWKISTPFKPGQYGPKTVLNLYRFMQEAISNTVRHSGANTLCIDLSCTGPSQPFRIYIADNGKGVPDLIKIPCGQGLKNMQARAKSLGAELVKGMGLGGKGLSYTLIIPPVTSS
ncbi:signal transduction histidine kinase [Litorimonas taeanensis]|uniref:histidine kinase n=1 Tax=Litorimonas taeanensis TaxID=568099 RepID=A0A420WDS4_9PROT|nr:hypothetical protein [Litorimonas taeanensis]RKQ69128.1 signal transduction histidine kinase [Litorimonas taeanensis]